MTVLETGEGLLVHSPLGVDPAQVAALGQPRWVLAPNLLHHLYVGPWLTAGYEGWAAPGLMAKRPDLAFEGELTEGPRSFGTDVVAYPLRCFPMTQEVVLHHRTSGTLVVTDLVFNLSAEAPFATRLAMACMCGYPGCRTTALERLGMNRPLARREVGALLELPFDRLIMAHGEVVETGGKQALRDALSWLGLPSGG